MSKTERIYAQLVEANPVPDPEALPDRLAAAVPGLRVIDPGREDMQTETTQLPTETPGGSRRGMIAAFATAAVVIAAVAIGALVLSDDGVDTASIPDDPVERVEAFIAALNAGDVDTAAAIAAPGEPPSEMDRNTMEFNAVMSAGYPWQVEGCAVASSLPTAVIVECALVNTDPVFIATGASELIAPWTVNDDGSMRSHEWQGGDHTGAVRTYADYLRATDLELFDAVCSPAAYPGRAAANNGGLALAKACAEVIVPLAPSVADWVEAGRPTP